MSSAAMELLAVMHLHVGSVIGSLGTKNLEKTTSQVQKLEETDIRKNHGPEAWKKPF